eukprot:TRINITY_DN3289_c0_g1_i1.p1 TRINITY_DN3289_c0_g1~~TRINITY_DN3289_c0_g1_i1.p1  ORF type:complete len:592 (+),score=140.92 TRINITY_DN3289_c0_g1_i1:156-1931(+)
MFRVAMMAATTFRYVGCVDVEATCCKDRDPAFQSEIIEFPCVVLDTSTRKVCAEFRSFVRPVLNTQLTEFCTELTGIRQAEVDAAPLLQDVLEQLHQWLVDQHLVDEPERFAFATDGPWDLLHFLHNECQLKHINKRSYFDSWINVRWLFAEFFSVGRCNIRKMLHHLKLSFHGSEHSGLWDARNVARIVVALQDNGCQLRINDGISDALSVKWRLKDRAEMAKSRKEHSDDQPLAEPARVSPAQSPTPLQSTNGAEAASATAAPKQLVDYFIVLDFEATCDDNQTPHPQEIIEFPSVLVSAKTLQIESEFHRYIKPTVHPTLSPFCTALTGITQEMVDHGVPLEQALQEHRDWMVEHGLLNGEDPTAPARHTSIFVTCGDWDLRICLPNQLKFTNEKPPAYLIDNHLNIKHAFTSQCHQPTTGMAGMLHALALPLEGRHHSGIDDCRNIARILVTLLRAGYVYHPKTSKSQTPKPKPCRTNKKEQPSVTLTADETQLLDALLALVTPARLAQAQAQVQQAAGATRNSPAAQRGKLVGQLASSSLADFTRTKCGEWEALEQAKRRLIKDRLAARAAELVSEHCDDSGPKLV